MGLGQPGTAHAVGAGVGAKQPGSVVARQTGWPADPSAAGLATTAWHGEEMAAVSRLTVSTAGLAHAEVRVQHHTVHAIVTAFQEITVHNTQLVGHLCS